MHDTKVKAEYGFFIAIYPDKWFLDILAPSAPFLTKYFQKGSIFDRAQFFFTDPRYLIKHVSCFCFIKVVVFSISPPIKF